MRNIGSQFRSLRLSQHMSQRQLAEASGVHYNTILNFENNRCSPSTDNLYLLLNAMGYELIIRKRSESKNE